MAFKQVNRRYRTAAAAGALAVNALLVAALLSLSTGIVPPRAVPGLVSFDVAPPPPAPPPPERKPGAAAPPSRGATGAPSPPRPPHPLPSPTPAASSADAGSQSAGGAGAAAGSGAGQGGQGNGTGGGGAVTPPVHIAGALTNADYARTDHPRGAAGTVTIAFRVRSDGAVDRCRVISSSGYPSIDEATCRLVQHRFRFRPALNASGQAIDFTLRTDFTWEPR